jgi:hypothetical protein
MCAVDNKRMSYITTPTIVYISSVFSHMPQGVCDNFTWALSYSHARACTMHDSRRELRFVQVWCSKEVPNLIIVDSADLSADTISAHYTVETAHCVSRQHDC